MAAEEEWEVDEFRQVKCGDKVICFVGLQGHVEDDEDQANAHLIAAALKMYGLLAHPMGTSHVTTDPKMIWIRLDEKKYKEALAKAEGKQ